MTKGAFPRLSDFPYLSRMEELLKAGGMSAMSAINPAFAVAGAAKPLFQLGLGIAQGARARSISRRNPRPTYNIPGAATNALYDQRNLAYGQTPGMNTAMQQLAQSQAGSISGIQNSGGGGAERLAALTMLDQNAGNQALDLAAMQEQFKERQMQNYIGAQNAYAGYQEKKRDWDVMQPYIDAQAKAAAMNDAANTNIHGALGEAGGIVSSVIKNGANGMPKSGPVDAMTPRTLPAQEFDALGAGQRTSVPGADDGLEDDLLQKSINTAMLPRTDPYSGLSTVEAGKSPAAILPQFDALAGSDDQSSIEQALLDERYKSGAPKFNPNEGMESYDLNSLSGSEVYSPDGKGPKPIGYDPKTKETNPVAGPQNYNPMPEEPKGPFPIGREPMKQAVKDIVSEVDAIDPEIAAKIDALLKGVKNKRRMSYDLGGVSNNVKKK